MKRTTDSNNTKTPKTTKTTKTTAKQGENQMQPNTALPPRNVMPQTLFEEKVAQLTCDNNRAENSFSNTVIANLAVEYKKLNNAEFHFTSLTDVHFTASLMYGVEFKFAELENVEFRNCNMEHCNFNFARFHNVSFLNCILDRSEFDLSSGDVKFENCSLRSSEFPMAQLDVQFHHCDLDHTEINGCPNLKLQAVECDCHSGEFNDSAITGNFTKCILSDASFYSTDGRNLTFTDNSMRDVNIQGALGISILQDDDDEDFDL